MFVVIFWLFLISAVRCHGPYHKNGSQILLRYFVRSTDDNFQTPINAPLDLLTFPGFDLNKRTVFYFHGFQEIISSESVQTVMKAYLQRSDHNLVIVDWSRLSVKPYLTNGAPNAIRVGRAVGRAIQQLVLKGAGLLNPLRIHLVGHSLGGQAAGFAGKALPFKVNRISLLDTAEPGFYGLGIHVKATDADFVDAIHTDAGIYGARLPTATVDFWPNGGVRPQPGCFPIPLFPYPISDQDLCSHWRSWRFWAESLLNETAFPAWKCRVNYFSSNDNRVEYIYDDSGPVYMGYAASNNHQYYTLDGDYCLESTFGA